MHLNTLLADKATDDRLRVLHVVDLVATPGQRASDAPVPTFIEAVVKVATTCPTVGTPLKAQLLGIDRIADYDRSGPSHYS